MKAKTLILALLSLVICDRALAYDFVVNGIYYNKLGGGSTVEVTFGNSSSNSYSGSVNISSTVSYSGKTYSVTSIGNFAFDDCTSLTSVTIPNSVTSIGYAAFEDCTSLTSVTIPNSVTSIGSSAFEGCTGITQPLYNNTIFAYMPTSYSGAYTIPSGIKTIADGAFSGCRNLTSVTIPNIVTSIGYSAFRNCTSLTSVTIPNSVTSIGDFAFYGCTGITQPLYNNTIFAYMPTSYSGAYTIPSGITTIAGNAFDGCRYQTSVTIPNSVTSIGLRAFYSCTNLSNVTIPNSVTSIGDYAFYGCTSLTSVTIPNSVTSIGNRAFYGCTGITQPLYNNTIFAYMSWSYNGAYSIPSGITTIAGYAFYGCTSVTSVTIPNSVTSIGDQAFYGCTSVTSVTIPNSVTSIGDQAFYGCTSLTSVTIPNSVTSIGLFAFDACTSLTSVTIPNSVTSIGYSAFSGCTSLTCIYFNCSTPQPFSSYYGFSDVFPNSVTTCYVPCGKTSDFQSAINNNSIQIFEHYTYSFSASSSDISLGTVSVTQQPSCVQPAIIRATATASHYHFARWSDGNTSNPRNVTVTSDSSLMAIFEGDEYTISASGTNGTVSGGGSYNYGSTATLTATGDTHYHFKKWSDGNTSNPRTVTVNGNATYTAIFEIDKHTISASGTNGTVSGGGSYDYGSTATLTATGDTHYHFKQWSDGNTSNPRTVTVSDNATYTAIFEIDQHTISASGTNGTVSGGGSYNYGSTATLTATGDTHYHFKKWSDGNTSNPRTVTVSGNATYTAIFEIDQHTISASGTNGTVDGCGSYDYGSTATLTAIGDEHYHFARWSDGNTSNPRNVTVTSDSSLMAIFEGDEYTISASCNHGKVSGGGTYTYQDVVTLTVTPDNGYEFTMWDDGNKSNPRIFTASEDMELEAICEKVTATEDVEETVSFFYSGTMIYNPANERLRVYSTEGKLIRTTEGDIQLEEWPAGLYIIMDDKGNSLKMIIH